MARLIDADALMETIRAHDYLLRVPYSNGTDNGMFTAGIQQAVDEQPTVDAVELNRDKLAEALDKLASYEDTGLSPEQCAKYAKAEAEGRLVVLLCKVGDEVWFDTWEHGIKNVGIKPHIIDCVDITLVSGINELVPTSIPLWELGKSVFLTREEAEKALGAENG